MWVGPGFRVRDKIHDKIRDSFHDSIREILEAKPPLSIIMALSHLPGSLLAQQIAG